LGPVESPDLKDFSQRVSLDVADPDISQVEENVFPVVYVFRQQIANLRSGKKIPVTKCETKNGQHLQLSGAHPSHTYPLTYVPLGN